MDIQKEIIDTIELMISKIIEKKNFSSDISSVIQDIEEINTRNKTYKRYKVFIQGSEYWIYDGLNLNPTIGQNVWIHIPANNYEDAYICALNRKEG